MWAVLATATPFKSRNGIVQLLAFTLPGGGTPEGVDP
jgi:hypothetical protein